MGEKQSWPKHSQGSRHVHSMLWLCLLISTNPTLFAPLIQWAIAESGCFSYHLLQPTGLSDRCMMITYLFHAPILSLLSYLISRHESVVGFTETGVHMSCKGSFALNLIILVGATSYIKLGEGNQLVVGHTSVSSIVFNLNMDWYSCLSAGKWDWHQWYI